MSNASIHVLEQHLEKIWSERDEQKRLKALDELYTKDCTLFEVGDRFTGHEAINSKINSILANMPADFVFTITEPVVINNNAGKLVWALGPKDKQAVATGMDIAILEDAKIKSLYVFLDEPAK